MNKTLLFPFLAVVSLSGCVVSNYSTGYYGDVTFSWTFAGLQCSAVPQVASVRITIPGEVLQNAGIYPCLSDGYPGIRLRDFAPRRYTYTIDALTYSNTVVYTATGSFTVNGDILVNVDLTPVGGGNSYAYLMWTFPPNSSGQSPTCAQATAPASQAGVSYVDVSIDQGSPLRYSCPLGMVAPGVQTPFINAGTHQIELRGVDSNGYPYFRSVGGTLTTYAGSPVSASYQLAWNVGGVSIAWQLVGGSCAPGQTVEVNFRDSSGNLVYGPQGDPQPCDGAPIRYNALMPGNYQVELVSTGSDGIYRSNTQNPPQITIRAGVFVDQRSAPLTVPMYRQ